MVIEALAQNGCGASGWALSFVQETLEQSRKAGEVLRPWIVLEAPRARSTKLFAAALNKELAISLREGELLWVKVSHSSGRALSHENAVPETVPETVLPDLIQVLIESSLCSGVLVRGFEGLRKSYQLRVWMRRWQLASEKTGTHLLWIHEKETDVLGVSLRTQWTSAGDVTIRKGEALLKDHSLESLRMLNNWPPENIRKDKRRENAHRQTERVA